MSGRIRKSLYDIEMKRNIYNLSYIIYCLIALGMGLAFNSCTKDDGPEPLAPEGTDVKVSFHISSATRAGSDPYRQEADHELINTWWIAFAEADSDGEPGQIVKIVKRDPSLSDAVHEETISVELAPADYFVFAFANLSAAELEAATGISMEEGSAGYKENLVKEGTRWNSTWNNIYDRLATLNAEISSSVKTALVPMSGMKKINVTRQLNQKYSIEVVRMLAKIRFEFANDTDAEITVNSVTVKPFIDGGSLKLFPQYNAGWDFLISSVSLPEGCTPEAEGYTFATTGLKVPGKTTVASDATSFTRYLREMTSETNLPSGLFLLEFNITREGSDGAETLYSYTSDGFNYINRNDFVVLPIRFSDWVIDFDVRYYPPIGGYPAKIVGNNDAEFSVSFGTGGTFEIIPKVGRNTSAGIDWLDRSQFEYEAASISGDILEKEVEQNAAGEIVGYIAGKTGSAYIRFSLTRITYNGKTYTSSLPIKKIYILRQ